MFIYSTINIISFCKMQNHIPTFQVDIFISSFCNKRCTFSPPKRQRYCLLSAIVVEYILCFVVYISEEKLLRYFFYFQVLFGLLSSLDKHSTHSFGVTQRPSPGSHDQHNVMPLASNPPRFTLLPLSSHSSAGHVHQAVDHGHDQVRN